MWIFCCYLETYFLDSSNTAIVKQYQIVVASHGGDEERAWYLGCYCAVAARKHGIQFLGSFQVPLIVSFLAWGTL